MLVYPEINPVALQLGPVAIHWYGLMYLLGFIGAWLLILLRIRNPAREFSTEQASDILFYGALGVIIGGRVGYMIFYAWPELIAHPFLLFQVWKGGMSFHGGLIGVMLALWLYAHKVGKSFFDITDLVAPVTPIGLGAGRIGNFINGELWGKVTDVPWGMIFPRAGSFPRHPSPLYEFFLEGVVLFCILWFYSAKIRPRGAVSGLFLICYGIFRFIIEFFREPDPQIGYIAFDWLTKGQLLSFPMILGGGLIMIWAYWSHTRCNNI